ncbi:MAG TPA: hypothetical protein PK760_06930 [Flavobacteriales bacterium]|nr:hypothetical protein [Flavobacteriales bacterium]
MSTPLPDIRMHNGNRHFASLPQTVMWYGLRDHLAKLAGARVTRFLTDDITEAWIDFTFRGHAFTVNDQFGEYWFFVDDPTCPDQVLNEVLEYCRPFLENPTSESLPRLSLLGRLRTDWHLALGVAVIIFSFGPSTWELWHNGERAEGYALPMMGIMVAVLLGALALLGQRHGRSRATTLLWWMALGTLLLSFTGPVISVSVIPVAALIVGAASLVRDKVK